MFIKFTLRDFKNVRTVFTELEDLSSSERSTLNKAEQIIELMKKDRAFEEEIKSVS